VEKGKKSEPNVGFQFNAPVTGKNQTFINGDVGSIRQGLSPDDLVKLDMLFQSFNEQVRQAASPDKQNQVEEKAQKLQAELSKGETASGDRLNKIVDSLLEMVPGAVSTIGSMFASPILGGLVGPATKWYWITSRNKQKTNYSR
jgi:hypothetical protein